MAILIQGNLYEAHCQNATDDDDDNNNDDDDNDDDDGDDDSNPRQPL